MSVRPCVSSLVRCKPLFGYILVCLLSVRRSDRSFWRLRCSARRACSASSSASCFKAVATLFSTSNDSDFNALIASTVSRTSRRSAFSVAPCASLAPMLFLSGPFERLPISTVDPGSVVPLASHCPLAANRMASTNVSRLQSFSTNRHAPALRACSRIVA